MVAETGKTEHLLRLLPMPFQNVFLNRYLRTHRFQRENLPLSLGLKTECLQSCFPGLIQQSKNKQLQKKKSSNS